MGTDAAVHRRGSINAISGNSSGPSNRWRHFAGGYVTADYFETLGVRPVAGRVFTAAEAQPGRDHVVLLREDFWRSEFGNKADNNFSILGTTMLVNGVKCDVVGICRFGLAFPQRTP